MFQRLLTRRAGTAACFLLLPLTTACVSAQTHQRALDAKDETIRTLRDERAQLKSENLTLRAETQNAGARTTPAQAPIEPAAPAAAAAPKANYPELDEAGVGYGERDGHMVMTLPAAITFDSGKADLSASGKKALGKVAATLKKDFPGARYSIEGHTDADPIKKSKFATNRELSVARSMAVLRYLVEECAIGDDECVVVGHGQYDPVAPGSSEAEKARNRRVEIVVSK